MSYSSNTNDPNLTKKRQRITQIDAGILALLDERMRLAAEIAGIKKTIGKDIEDLSRETQLLSELIELNRETLLKDNQLNSIWKEILKASKENQEEVRQQSN